MIKKIMLLFMLLCTLVIVNPLSTYASSDEMDIFDVMNEYGQHNDVDSRVMTEATSGLQNTAGRLMSAIIYLLFAMVGFNTAVDMLYISVPFLRPYLYDGNVGKDKVGMANANLIGRNEYWTQAANNNMARANMHANNAQAYQNIAQQRAMNGDMNGARRAVNIANNEANLANSNVRHANENMNMQAWSDNWRAKSNQNTLQRAQNRAEQNSK